MKPPQRHMQTNPGFLKKDTWNGSKRTLSLVERAEVVSGDHKPISALQLTPKEQDGRDQACGRHTSARRLVL